MNGHGLQAKRYTREWLLFIFLAGSLGILLLFPNKEGSHPYGLPIQQPSLNVASPGKRGVIILKIPEATEENWGGEAPDKKFETWILALIKNGYHPLLLSDALNRLLSDASMPNRAIVLMFDPGYRQTYEDLSPLLKKYGIPAFWVTDQSVIQKADMRFLSNHQTRLMEESGQWDVALKDEAGNFSLTKIPSKSWRFKNEGPALNILKQENLLNRLSANAKWTEPELLDRLSIEQSIEGPVYLTSHPIQDRNWGLAEEEPSRFDLTADTAKRSGMISWFPTTGHNNFQLNLNVKQVAGEFWVYLRSSPTSEDGVHVGFTQDLCVLEQHHNGFTQQLGSSLWTRPPDGSLSAEIKIQDQTITVLNAGNTAVSSSKLVPPISPDGRVELMVYDKVRGAAQALSIEMKMTPL